MGGLGGTCSMGHGTDIALPGMLKESELLLSNQALSIFARENSSNLFTSLIVNIFSRKETAEGLDGSKTKLQCQKQ